MVDYKISTQCYPKKILQGVCKEKISKAVIKAVSYTHIKIIFIIIIQPHPSMTPHPNTNIPPHPYPSITPQPICLCPYCTSTPIYETDGVVHHPHILYLGYSHQPPTRRLPYSMSPNLISPDESPN